MQWLKNCGKVSGALMRESGAQTACRWGWDADYCNNLAERSIKPFVIGRKNFLFANTSHGAQGSAVIYSMIETAKANNLDPYRYLTWVLTNAPMLASSGDDWATTLLPAHAPDHCRST